MLLSRSCVGHRSRPSNGELKRGRGRGPREAPAVTPDVTIQLEHLCPFLLQKNRMGL